MSAMETHPTDLEAVAEPVASSPDGVGPSAHLDASRISTHRFSTGRRGYPPQEVDAGQHFRGVFVLFKNLARTRAERIGENFPCFPRIERSVVVLANRQIVIIQPAPRDDSAF